ncbi:hypothetical protein JW960_23490 [candidate division KSB1 bacterium]|nr:hypothetical protein [candidate division KSB1 bacterium]
MKSEIFEILKKSLAYIDENGLESYDPFDALTSPIILKLTFNNSLLKRYAIQAVKRLPVNVRPCLKIKKKIHVMSMAHLVLYECLEYHDSGESQHKSLIEKYINIIKQNAIDHERYYSWGLGFRYSTRFVDTHSNTPNIFTTLNIANSLIEAAQILENDECIYIAEKAGSFIIERLGFVKEESALWFKYYPDQMIPVYNVNAMVGAFFLNLWKITSNDEYKDFSQKAILFIEKHQNNDGSWYYARDDAGKWIDGFHTGYILESLLFYLSEFNDSRVAHSLAIGANFYKDYLFTDDGLPKYQSISVLPMDSQNFAQAIQTLAKLSVYDNDFLTYANKAYEWSIQYLFRDLGDIGYFIAARNKLLKNQNYYLRWSQAPMILAMKYLQLANSGKLEDKSK